VRFLYFIVKVINAGVGPLLLAPEGRPHTVVCQIVGTVYQSQCRSQVVEADFLEKVR
jgi:hypothetical protein